MGTMRVALRGIFIAATIVAAGGCAARDKPGADKSERSSVDRGEGAPSADSVAESEASLFELHFALTDQKGKERHLSDLRGRPFVASMIYTRCTSVCPRVTADLKNLEKALDDRDRERVRFVLFSLDPERDGPRALRAFAAEHALDSTRWTLFSTSPDDMRTLAAVLGVRHRPDAGGEIAHSAVIAVVDANGVVRHRQVGIESDASPLVAAVRAAE